MWDRTVEEWDADPDMDRITAFALTNPTLTELEAFINDLRYERGCENEDGGASQYAWA